MRPCCAIAARASILRWALQGVEWVCMVLHLHDGSPLRDLWGM